jgi:nitrogen regulatory protein PII
MKSQQVSKIILIINNDFNDKVLELLSKCGILKFYNSVGRQNYLRKAMNFPNFFAGGHVVSARQSDIFRFYIPHEYEKRMLSYLSNRLNLKVAGNGSVFAQDAEIISKSRKLYSEEMLEKLPQADNCNLFSYNLVKAIVQHGSADSISKSILEMGYGVPAVYFGEGVGLRQKLGLLRIVIPADKEIILIPVLTSSTESFVETIKKVVRLDIPGRGVLFVEPIRAINVNIRIYQDTTLRHAATMDQIITSIDIMHGSTDWRARNVPAKSSKQSSREKEYCNFVLIAEEDSLGDTIQAALARGVGGATSTDYNEHFYDEEEKKMLSYQTKEGCEMIVNENQKNDILTVMKESGFYDDEINGILEITDLNFFYLPRNK